MRREQEGLGNALEHILFGLGPRQVGGWEMLPGFWSRLHQVLDPEGPYGLHDIGTDAVQNMVTFLLSKH